MSRIGKIELIYARDPLTGLPIQLRGGVTVENPNSSIAKLLTVYCALGGNPLDISLFLYSDDEEQPGNGFAFPKGFSYSLQGQEQDEDSNIDKFQPSRIGGTRDTETQLPAANMGMARQAFIKEMYQKRILLEERILKLADLYEQLEKERILMMQAQGRGAIGNAVWESQKYDKNHSVPCLVYLLDSTFRYADEDGTVTWDADPNLTNLGQMPMLLSDVVPGDDNNAL